MLGGVAEEGVVLVHSVFGFEAAGDEFGGCEEVDHAIFLAVHLQYTRRCYYIRIRIIHMSCCKKKESKNLPPRERKIGPYEKVNAYTQPFSREQILTLILFSVQLAGHSALVVPVIFKVSHSILWTILGFHFVLLLAVAHDYIYLTTKDPVDRMITNQDFAGRFSSAMVKQCLICNCQVHKNSHHCMRCNRCTEQFDHHCRFLNNCIGSRNYEAFFRLLLTYSLYNFNIVGMAIWTARYAFGNEDSSRAWAIVIVGALTLLIEIAVAALLGFQCYITCQNMTTFQHNYKPKNMDDVINQININLWEAPVSSDRIRRQEIKPLH